ncbi:hypothetical protein SEMRO_190_G081750.1 [Seminavis robusta]|uniref:Uncharacterized protein n=1 Tax=Seminavis robusta TaxID=568900 RepID=A0A9N8DJD0_9STRA|nr:hypothetical protein SEMRO_190_G081750.1 [Seminavis robusta]|eukprot:Sro190_g081750.1 n/a (287) ;mRNA; r:23698-24558
MSPGPNPPSPNADGMFGFFTQQSPQVLPPTSPLKAKGNPKDDRLYETPEKEKENVEPRKRTTAKRPPLTPSAPPAQKLTHVQPPSIEKQINQQLAEGMAAQDAAGNFTGGHMTYGESPFMFLLADMFVTSRTKTHRLGWWKRGGKSGSPDSFSTQQEMYQSDIEEGTLKQWLIEENENNARILAKKGPPTPHRMGEPKPPKEKKNEPQKLKLPKGGKSRIDEIMRIVRQGLTNEFLHNPRMMELSAGEIANRMEGVAMTMSLEATNLPSAVNHARAIAKKKEPKDI